MHGACNQRRAQEERDVCGESNFLCRLPAFWWVFYSGWISQELWFVFSFFLLSGEILFSGCQECEVLICFQFQVGNCLFSLGQALLSRCLCFFWGKCFLDLLQEPKYFYSNFYPQKSRFLIIILFRFSHIISFYLSPELYSVSHPGNTVFLLLQRHHFSKHPFGASLYCRGTIIHSYVYLSTKVYNFENPSRCSTALGS